MAFSRTSKNGTSNSRKGATAQPVDDRGAGLTVRGVSVDYRTARTGVKRALRDVNLSVAKGEVICIVGTSGCGKTTLLKAIDGLVPISGGSIEVNGRPVTGPGHDRAVVFQAPSLLPWRSVEGNISYGIEMRSGGRRRSAQTKQVVRDLIRLVGLEGHEKAFAGELSGGMQQRVNLARALAVDPELLLLDEPFAALDAQTREAMQTELLNIWERTHKTATFITHQIDEAVYLADRVVVMTARSGGVRETIEIDIPRPRSPEIRHDPRFMEYVEQIRALIDEEGRATATPPAAVP